MTVYDGKPGRPTALVFNERTLKQVTGAGRIGCTFAETAAVLGVSQNTLKGFFEDWPEAREAWEAGNEAGKASLRRKQHEVALKGNPVMLIWTGKQRLGQSDKIESHQTVSLEALVLASVKQRTAPALKEPEAPLIDQVPDVSEGNGPESVD